MDDGHDDERDQPAMADPAQAEAADDAANWPSDASAIGAATAAKTRPISAGASNASNTICWIEAM